MLRPSRSEVSPVASVTLEDYVTDIAISIRYAVEAGSGPVILVGHSPSGIATTAVAERHPEFIANLVYLSAFHARCWRACGNLHHRT